MAGPCCRGFYGYGSKSGALSRGSRRWKQRQRCLIAWKSWEKEVVVVVVERFSMLKYNEIGPNRNQTQIAGGNAFPVHSHRPRPMCTRGAPIEARAFNLLSGSFCRMAGRPTTRTDWLGIYAGDFLGLKVKMGARWLLKSPRPRVLLSLSRERKCEIWATRDKPRGRPGLRVKDQTVRRENLFSSVYLICMMLQTSKTVRVYYVSTVCTNSLKIHSCCQEPPSTLRRKAANLKRNAFFDSCSDVTLLEKYTHDLNSPSSFSLFFAANALLSSARSFFRSATLFFNASCSFLRSLKQSWPESSSLGRIRPQPLLQGTSLFGFKPQL